MSVIYLVLLTYAASPNSARASYAYTTLDRALRNLRTTHVLKVHLADDGSDPQHIDNLLEICKQHGAKASVTNAMRKGYGASYNYASQVTHVDGEYFLMLEDDWELTRIFDLDPLIACLHESTPEDYFGCIRLGYLGWTQQLVGDIKKYNDMTFLRFHPDSPEPHVWSGHPRLETLNFQKKIGPWPEGLDPGSTEFVVAQRKESRDGVAWPLDAKVNASQDYCNTFAHIGAIQARTDQEVS